MKWLGRLVSGPDAEALRAEGEALLARDRPGEAKLAFERALEKARRNGAEDVAAIEQRIADCGDALARACVAAAEAYVETGSVDEARHALDDAAEVARSPDVVAQVEAARDRLERSDAKERAGEPEPLSDEERLALLAGSWEGPQADEYETYGEALDGALLRLADGDGAAAREAIEALLETAERPVYLHLEHARACAACEDEAETRGALERFLASAPTDVPGDSRLAARLELARLAGGAEGLDAAVTQLEAAIEEHPGDYRPLFHLGSFLRNEGHAEEAVDVLVAGAELLDDQRPDWRFLQELGLARRDAGQAREAIEVLEGVLRLFTAQRATRYPQETLEALAALQEAADNPTRAADYWRTLAEQGPRGGLVRYHLEAARLVAGLGDLDEARRLLRRAAGLAEGDEEASRMVAERLGAIGG